MKLEGLNRVEVATILALGSDQFIYIHKEFFGAREGFLLMKAPKQQTYKSRFNTEMKQDEYSTAGRPLH